MECPPVTLSGFLSSSANQQQSGLVDPGLFDEFSALAQVPMQPEGISPLLVHAERAQAVIDAPIKSRRHQRRHDKLSSPKIVRRPRIYFRPL